MESIHYRVLVVDDEEVMRNLIVTFLSKLGHLCLTAINGVDALDKMKGNKVDAVVTDIKIPEMDGITLTSEILNQYPGLPIMVMTVSDEEYSAKRKLFLQSINKNRSQKINSSSRSISVILGIGS
jgi:CheY-like chemotaxis protein